MDQSAENLPVVELRGIKKHFGAVSALRGVDLVLNRHEVLGLMGDNAAGKSTLMKVLSGAYVPNEGKILVDGQEVNFASPMDARRRGIEMVYQDYALANNLDVAGNVFMGREVVRFKIGPLGVMDYPHMERETRSLIDRLKIDLPSVRQKVERLSGGQRQAVAIARATAFDAKVIIMDEPTAALSVAAIDKVLDLIRQLRSQGSSVIIISHRLEDIFRVADRMIVLRQGRKVCDAPVEGDIQDFRERVLAYMIGARDDFAPVQSAAEAQ
ncbi:MAG: ATP-binding cassette domain-containing protein [Anaerolineae bacterium]|nr:ATP-binding cassette domain-containing protein [Anaerolineae bacterium]